MEKINALQAKKLNSQITCTSYYDFLTKERRCLKAFNRMGMQRDPPCKTETKNLLGSAMDSARHYDVDDTATQWYLGARASPVKNPWVCQSKYHPIRHARQRRLKANSYPLPGRRVSPEFLSLLKQHQVRTQVPFNRKCRRPKTSFAYYKYDAEGKRRHMRPGIDTAAPLEFPSPMEMDDPEHRKRLLRGQDKVIDPPAPLGSEEELQSHDPLSPKSKRIKNSGVRRTKDKGNQDRNINAKDLKWLEVGNLEFPSTTEGARGKTYLKTSLMHLDNKDSLQKNIETGTNNHQLQSNNPSVPVPPHLHDPSPLINFTEQLAKYAYSAGPMAIPLIKNKKIKDPRLMRIVKGAFFKVVHGCSDGVSIQSEGSKHSEGNQCSSDGNNNMEIFPPCAQEVLNDPVRKNHSVNSSQKTDVTDKKCGGILRTRPSCKASACDSDFRKMKKVRIASCSYQCQKKYQRKNPHGSKINPKITGQEESRLAEGEHENPNSGGCSPNNSERPLTRKGTSCIQTVVKPSSFNYLKTNQSKWVNPPNIRIMEKPKTYTDPRNACPRSEVKQRETPKQDLNHTELRQEKSCQCPSQKDLIETNPNGSKVNPDIKGQENSKLAERKTEKPNYSGKCPNNNEIPSTCKGTSLYVKSNQSNLNNRKVEKPKTCTETRNTSSGRPYPCKRSSRTRTVAEPSSGNYSKTNQSKWGNPPNCRKMEKPKASTEIRNTCRRSEARQQVPPKKGCQEKTRDTQKVLTETNSYVSVAYTEVMGQESRLAVREYKKPDIRGKSPDNCRRPLRCKGSSRTRTVSEPRYGCHLKNNQSTKKRRDSCCNCREVKRPRVTPICDPSPSKKRCPVKPPVTKRLVNNEQLKKCGTITPRHSKPKERNCCNLKRCQTKPIPIRCDPVTKKCVPFPHSSGNEKTDLKRWLYPTSCSHRRRKRYTKTRKTLRKGCRTTRKCHQSDSSSSCEQNPCRLRQKQRARAESCRRCPYCSSVCPPRCSRFQEVPFPSASNNQRFCLHNKLWCCKPKCQVNSQGCCEQISYAPYASRQFTRCWESRRMRGGVDLREEDDFIPGRNRGVSHSFSSSLSSDSDSNRQVKYTKPRKWSVHAFHFD